MSAVVTFAQGLRDHPEGLPDFDYAWLEAPRAAMLVWLEEVKDWQDPEEWPQGRIFGSAGEYRWRREADGTLHSVLILEDGEAPATFRGSLTLEDPEDRSLILWGDWVDKKKDEATNPKGGPVYYSPDLPQAQTYPLPAHSDFAPGKGPCLMVRRYRSSEGTFQRALAVDLRNLKEDDDA